MIFLTCLLFIALAKQIINEQAKAFFSKNISEKHKEEFGDSAVKKAIFIEKMTSHTFKALFYVVITVVLCIAL